MILLILTLPAFAYLLAIIADRYDRECGSGKWPAYVQHVISAFKTEFGTHTHAEQYAYIIESEAGL